ncbi:GNAT family N-acetyltransferase [Shewanella cyperi]|uniref:GNAT family N-acetyltransferase n=1 Tax=Shewanella cyperi TaxID=2814292 RepID=UPI001A94EA01|nr:GNAT family N-acetyltransferase [Shewanella cyperi]QSX39722.1 GNAT family N-acetyltransferase [Shewanella cyperi]
MNTALSAFSQVLDQDMYYRQGYRKLYLEPEAQAFDYCYEEGPLQFKVMSIKRPILQVAGQALEEEWYDLETHYGYGGPLSNSADPDFLARAFDAYRHHCANNRIICEFIRFHPLNELGAQAGWYDFHALERQVVSVDLRGDETARWQGYSKTCRNLLRRSLECLTVDEQLPLEDFLPLYRQTMDKNRAAAFFYFDQEYFQGLASLPGCRLLGIRNAQGQLISAGFFFFCPPLAHYHLSANLPDAVRENGNYLLLEHAFRLAKAAGCQQMLLGGGRTAATDDSLFKFKTKFSKDILPFYISGIDFIPGQRNRLNALWQAQFPQRQLRHFQKYRLTE